jgi:hypothetical protein
MLRLLMTCHFLPNTYIIWLDVIDSNFDKLGHFVNFELVMQICCYVVTTFSSITCNINIFVQFQNVNLSHVNYCIACTLAN